MNKRTCSFDGCGNRHRAKGLCSGHWQQQALGKPLTKLNKHSGSVPMDVDKILLNYTESSDKCWIWVGRKNRDGYGRPRIDGKDVLAHRRAWELAHGPIPEGAIIDHTCHTPACVNPSHLRIADHTLNMQNRRGASAHSKSGIRGVSWDSSRSMWRGQVSANGKTFRKRFSSIEDASAWVSDLRKSLHAR